jgi:aspartyl-tRNA(Asn)/glutamyl-tRNA(Gln) amidotransferase subunit C
MINFNLDELRKIAKLSSLQLNDEEIKAFALQIKTVLEYLEELDEVQVTDGREIVRNINVCREDKPIETDSSRLLAQAPETMQTYFVVPKILD